MPDKIIDPCFIPLGDLRVASLIPAQLNDPFSGEPPEICEIVALDLCKYIEANQREWQQNFGFDDKKEGPVKGKMFGVLAVEDKQGNLGYLAAFSGKFAGSSSPNLFVPSLFDVSTNNNFITKGMRALSAFSTEITNLEKQADKESGRAALALRQMRKEKSQSLQDELFSHYHFLNSAGQEKSLVDIFKDFNGMKPPSAAGECAAPKLLHYAFNHNMKALAIAEFWWGNTVKPVERKHRHFYPACENKCRPILGYILGEF